MPHFDSIALGTNLFLWRATSSVIDRGNYVVVSTPDSPGWYWGNILIFPDAPGAGDYQRWTALFEREFGDNAAIKHRIFNWPGTADDNPAFEPFLSAGYELEESNGMLASNVIPPLHGNPDVAVRMLHSEEDWEALIELHFRCRPERFEPVAYRRFLQRRVQHFRKMIDAGMGAWFGAFLNADLAGGLGLFRDGDVARFQEVHTDPALRRRGICATLVHEVSRLALDTWGVTTLVMEADEEEDAQRIYARVGFEPREKLTALYWYPERNLTGYPNSAGGTS